MKNKIANGMPFINDKDVIGKWEFFDIIKTYNDFNKNAKSTFSDKVFKDIYFLPNGEKYWIFEGWTKNHLLIHYGGDEPILCYSYTIKNVDDEKYLFIKIDDYYNVLKKVSSKEYKLQEIGRRDNIDLPFILDENVIGKWKSVGFVDDFCDFTGKITPHDQLWLKYIVFNYDGCAIRTYSDEIWTDNWTKGYLIDKIKLTTSAYHFKEISGIEFLFVEWKMGNYVYGGAEPSYYVFVKEN